jgi:hypothetical protein
MRRSIFSQLDESDKTGTHHGDSDASESWYVVLRIPGVPSSWCYRAYTTSRTSSSRCLTKSVMLNVNTINIDSVDRHHARDDRGGRVRLPGWTLVSSAAGESPNQTTIATRDADNKVTCQIRFGNCGGFTPSLCPRITLGRGWHLVLVPKMTRYVNTL